ncbi:MAG: AraC family transcriptional regulator [Bacteroidales bacterium]|nr:AraC family transcriptional regulator [Bacteroidales bacterium]
MYFTEPLEDVGQFPTSRLLPDGRMVIAGGISDSNYEPHAATYIFSVNPVPRRSAILPVLAGIIIIGACAALITIRRRRRRVLEEPPAAERLTMAQRIESLMRDRQLFKRADLRLADVARELNTNTTYVSACVNSETGLSFPDYVATFRVRYAQRLMCDYPDKPLPDVAAESGFANEKSFYRTFKAHTGKTPGAWRTSHAGGISDK